MVNNWRQERPVRWILASLSIFFGLAAACFILIFAFRNSTVLPFWDQWSFVGEVANDAGHYSLANFWAQHNEHRIVIPKIFLLADLLLFKAKNEFLLVCILVTQFLTACICCSAIRQQSDLDRSSKVTLYGFTLLLLFSPVQMDNFVWGYQITFVLATFFTVVSFYCFARAASSYVEIDEKGRHKDFYFALSLFASMCATLSLASGLFIWPILFLIAVAGRLGRRKVLILVVCWFLVYVAYFYHYQRPGAHSDPMASLAHPGLILQYLSLYVGGAWISFGPTLASCAGFAGMALSIALLASAARRWNRISSSSLFFLCLLVFVLLSGTITGLGRIRFGVAQGYSSRYQTVALLLWVALSSLSLSWLTSKFGKSSAFYLIALVAASLFLWSPFANLNAIVGPYSARAGQWRVVEVAAITGVADPLMEKTIIEDPQQLQPLLSFLKQRSLSVFSEARFRQIGSPLTNFYTVDPRSQCIGAVQSSLPQRGVVSNGSIHSGSRLAGWAADRGTNEALRHLLIVGENGRIVGFGTGGYPDAAAAHRQNSFDGWFGYGSLHGASDRFRVFGLLRDDEHVCAIGNQTLSAQSFLSYDAKSPRLALTLSRTSQGVFRAGQWWRDAQSSLPADRGASSVRVFGEKGDLPVIGDWDGSGQLRIGVFRRGQWWLDMNGNNQWDVSDRMIVFGQGGDIPITGDWDGTGKLRMGVFRKGQWWLDMNGNGRYDAGDQVVVFGQEGDLPVVGDWDGTGRLRIGIFRNGQWWLDINGDLKWQDGVDQVVQFGGKGDLPVIGNWDGVGKLRIGVFHNGHWMLDMNGNNTWDGSGVDSDFTFGQPADVTSVLPWPK